MRTIADRMSYANVVATLALLVALGGTSYAAAAITGRDVQDNTLTTRDIRNGSLLAKDMRPRQLGVRGYQKMFKTGSVPAGAAIGATVHCPAGKHVLGGGVSVVASKDIYVIQSGATSIFGQDRSGWSARIQNVSGTSSGFQVTAFCAEVQ